MDRESTDILKGSLRQKEKARRGCMTAFEIVADTFIDECQIEIIENHQLPLVVDERNPFRFMVEYKGGIWYCEAHYQCRENPDEFVTIRRSYSAETVACIATFYNGVEDGSD